MRALLVLLLLLLPPLEAHALQDIPLDVRQIDISSERGSFNSVIATAVDPEGYIWFASIRGLFVYDGNTVRPALQDALEGTRINDILIDRSGTLWAATNSGVLVYNLKTRVPRWHRKSDTESGLVSETVYTIYEDSRGNIWAGTVNGQLNNAKWSGSNTGGLHRFEPSFDRFERVSVVPLDPSSKHTVFDICEDPQRDMWVATDEGLFRLTGNQGPAVFVPLSSGESYGAKNIAFDGAGNLWLGVKSKGLWCLPANRAEDKIVPVAEVDADQILDLFRDSTGDVWICTERGLFRFAHQEGRFYRHSFVLPDPHAKEPRYVASITETASGGFWIGTFNQGVLHRAAHPGATLARLRKPGSPRPMGPHELYCAASLMEPWIYVAPRGGAIFRTEPVDKNKAALTTELMITPFLDQVQTNALTVAPDGALLCGTDTSLMRVSPQHEIKQVFTGELIGKPYDDNSVRHIQPMKNGRIWFASKFKLYSWHPDENEARLEMTSGNDSAITSLAASDATLWIGHGQNIRGIDTVTGSITSLQIPPPVWSDDATIKTVFPDTDGAFWLGTTRQIFRFSPQTNTATAIPDSSGDDIANALSFIKDNAGNLWLHTQEKIYEIPAGSDRAVEMAIGADHPSVSISSSPSQLSSQTLVYGHSDGLLFVEPSILRDRPPTRPKISEIRIFGRPLAADFLGRMPSTLEAEYSQNYLIFTFSIPELNVLRKPHFFYMLEGVDPSWVDAGHQSTVSYAHLAPGQYVLHLKDGADGAVTTSMTIVIRPPWWLTSWAKAGYVLVLLAVVTLASLVFSRVQTTRIRKEMLENLVMQDPLTGVPNRRKFKEVLVAEKSRCKRSNHQISVIMIDIDFFKGFNDRFGHQAGDKALRTVAQTLSRTLKRPEDFLARYGGEEFVVVLPSTNRAGAERVAQKIQNAVHEAAIPYPGSPLSDRVTVSLGISTFSPQTDLHIDSGLFSADQALYQAKRNGRNCFFYKDHCLSLTPLRQ